MFALRRAELRAAAMHRHTFVEFVTQHRLGKLVLIDDGMGLELNFYMLELNHPVPDAQQEGEALYWMKYYVENDHGQALSVV